jgi:hypothetical protein
MRFSAMVIGVESAQQIFAVNAADNVEKLSSELTAFPWNSSWLCV